MNMFKKNGGFTLVELIVVIAILAILAAVAVPAYSGYIAKADEAADTQLVSAINTAFAAACVENGIAPTDIADNKVSFSAGAVDITDTTEAIAALATKIEADFATYYGNNASMTFKRFNTFTFANGNFTGSYVAPSGT